VSGLVARCPPSFGLIRSSKKEEIDPQGVGYLLQSTGADAIRSLLIFLHLLEGYYDCSAQVGLAH
jgi:hypothetical protein